MSPPDRRRRPEARPSHRYGVLASVRVLLGPTVLNAGGAREKPLGALTAFYLCNVPNCVPGHVPATAYHEARATTLASGTHLAEVEVDPETGALKILRYVVAHDCGRPINPLLVAPVARVRSPPRSLR